MNATVNGAGIDQWLGALAGSELLPKAPTFKDHGKISKETFHDFAAYLYVLDPWLARPHSLPVGPQPLFAEETAASSAATPGISSTVLDPAALEWLDAEAAQVVEAFISEARRASADPAAFDEVAIRRLMERFVVTATAELASIYLAPQYIPGRRSQLLFVFMERALPDLVDKFARLPAEHRETFLLKLDTATREWIGRASILDKPWMFAPATLDNLINNPYRTPQGWADIGYELSSVYQRLPTLPPVAPPVGSLSQLVNFPAPPVEEVHLLVWDTDVPQPVAYGWYNWTLSAACTTLFVGVAPSYSRKTNLLVEADKLLALVPPPDPSKSWLTELVDEIAAGLVKPNPTNRTSASPEEQYGFTPYPYPSINIGLQVIYRQTWRALDPGQGELLRTIPLGPGQTEKVTIRRVVRDKVSRQLTDASSTDSETESSNKTTISSEIVEEASRSSKWHIDQSAQGGVNMGVWNAGGSTQAGYESQSSSTSRDTKKRLNDVAQRTSAKMRRESRLVVSTERETTLETTQTSEIRNPNEELAVTYYYYALQQQYEVKTGLASVEPVVFVGERLPKPGELTVAWIQRHDWLLGQNLLDDSFRGILSRISTLDLDGLKQEIVAKQKEVDTLRDSVVQAQASLAALGGLAGNVANTYEGTLKTYQEAVRSALELARQVQATVRDAQRLGQHIADNILHYMRGIWSAEDPDRRRMRYSAVSWPTRFTPAVDSLDSAGTVFGHFTPVAGSEAPLSDLIDPAGPIAFAGNYAVFQLRKTDVTAGLTTLIRQRELDYVQQTFTTDPPNIAAVEVLSAEAYAGEAFVIALTGANAASETSYRVDCTPARSDTDGEGLTVLDGAGLVLQLARPALKITLKNPMAQNDVLRISSGPLLLRDPELSYLQTQRPTADITALTAELEKANTRMIVADTDNVYLQIDPSPLLEPFKQYHRMLDVAKSLTEVLRRTGRLAEKEYGDPDVEKIVIVSNGNKLDGTEVVAALSESLNPAEATPVESGGR
jgi:hypothetical protein